MVCPFDPWWDVPCALVVVQVLKAQWWLVWPVIEAMFAIILLLCVAYKLLWWYLKRKDKEGGNEEYIFLPRLQEWLEDK